MNATRHGFLLVFVGCSVFALLGGDTFSPTTAPWSAEEVLAERESQPGSRVYHNRLVPVIDDRPILADFPEFIDAVIEERRFEAPPLINDEDADLSVRAWRFSYNARGIIEIPNRLRASETAIVVVHPWGIDDGQGWKTPEPAGVAFACTPLKNQLMIKHAAEVINPFLKRLRPHVGAVVYSLPGQADPIRSSLYRTMDGTPDKATRTQASRKLRETLNSFEYSGGPLPDQLTISDESPVADYFRQFPGLSAGDQYNQAGFWQLPIPVMNSIEVADDDVVVFDGEGYEALRDFLVAHGVRHILLCGYHADMCVCSTTAGYENLRKDFNVFLVGDAVQATFPANLDAAAATNQTVSFASLDLLISQVSWIE